MAATERIRLHITPFNPDLLDRYIPPSLKSQVSNISFHTVETFPERGFGYVELPTMEAQKLKKKLNGSTLKGAKVKIEEAKPEKKKRKSSEAVEEDTDDKKGRKKAKKEQGVIRGHELEEGRRVKRGWDEKNPGKRSKKEDGEGLEGKKMRFKTVVPPNKAVAEGKEQTEQKSKSKKDKKEKVGKNMTVVKEFAKTVKPTDKGAVAARNPASYEEGVGWVDEDGNVVEEEPPQKKRKRSKAPKEAPKVVAEPELEPMELEIEDAGSDSEDSDPENKTSEGKESNEQPAEQDEDSESDSVDSVHESDSGDEDEQVNRQLKQAQTNLASNAAVEREQSNSVPIPDAIPSAERDPTPAEKEVHPLEALFKRRSPAADDSLKSKKPTPIDTSFSFFNSGADDHEDQGVTEDNPPQTPHTKQDLEWRSMRSAAPTPDTAAIGKRFSFPFAAEDVEDDAQDEDVDMEDDRGDEMAAGAATSKDSEKEESEFRKWFYNNRGDLNRSWKNRRREEKKAMRQRENRRLGRRLA